MKKLQEVDFAVLEKELSKLGSNELEGRRSRITELVELLRQESVIISRILVSRNTQKPKALVPT